MHFSGDMSLVQSRVIVTKQGQQLRVTLLDVGTGSRVGAFLPTTDRLSSVPQGTILHFEGDLAFDGRYLNATNLVVSPYNPPALK